MKDLLIVTLTAATLTLPLTSRAADDWWSTHVGSGEKPASAVKGKSRTFAFNQENTSGWSLMTAQERSTHRARMLAAKSGKECKSLQEAHQKAMQARALKIGKTLPAPRINSCAGMKARGFFK